MLQRVVKRLALAAGYDITRYVEPPPVRPFDVLRLMVRDRLAQNPDFTFVQVGANDGVQLDPLRELVLGHGLRGLFVEPVPDLFDRLRQNYAGRPGLEFECCAVGPADGQGVLYRVRPGSPLPDWAQLLASFNKAHLRQKLDHPDLDRYIEALTVPVLSIRTLLTKHGLTPPTLLQVDTEGFDAEVVRMTLEAGIRPPLIQYEFEHVRSWDRAATKRRLADAGYEYVDVGTDTIAALPG